MNKTIPLESFYFMRHGATHWNDEGRCQGQSDIPLNAAGHRQARQAAHYLLEHPIATIVTSPLKRAKLTAEILSEMLGNKQLVIIEELREASWGEIEGRVKGDGPWVDQWQKGHMFARAEPYAEFIKRIAVGLEKALKLEGPVLIVGHSGVYMAIKDLLSVADASHLDNCAVVLHTPSGAKDSNWTAHCLVPQVSAEKKSSSSLKQPSR